MRQGHPAFVWVAYGVLAILNLIDLVYTEDALRIGMSEGNPFMARIYEDFGIMGLAVVKGIILAFVFCLIPTLKRFKIAEKTFYLMVLVYTALTFYHLWVYLFKVEQLGSVFTFM